jgi:hypothetical protein
LQEYNLHNLTLEQRYKHSVVAYYVRKLNASLDRREFTEAPPAKDWEERLVRAKTTFTTLLNKGEKKINELGT